MSGDKIATLLDELKKLQIREAHILTLLEEAANEQDKDRISDPAPPCTRTNDTGFKPGDRVVIISRVKKPKGWPRDQEWSASLARRARVTLVHTGGSRVYIVDDNGWQTWRLPSNLRHEQSGR